MPIANQQNGATTTAAGGGVRFGGAALAEAREGASLVGRVGRARLRRRH